MWWSRYQLADAWLHRNWLIKSVLAASLLTSGLVITTSCLASMTPVVLVDSCFPKAATNQLNLNNPSINKLSVKDLSYWDHTNTHSDEFSGLRFLGAENGNSKYRLTSVRSSNSESKSKSINTQSPHAECYNREIVLVKKLIHNKRQHANGIEMRLKEREFTFGNLASFKMRFQLNRALSFTPQVASLSSVVNTALQHKEQQHNEQALGQANEKQPSQQKIINDLIGQNIRFKLMFYGENHSDYTVKTAYSEKLIVLPSSLSDVVLDTDTPDLTDSAWLELEIKSTDLTAYWQQNWQETPATLSELTQQPILGFILVAETPSGKTLESLVSGFSEPNVKLKDKLKDKELFIETYLRLGSMSIERRTK
ncbi:hypothetical protein GCM10008107_11420 [Psychrosphaera saromensis]|uniref:Uncharacterized protein n=1 Tax=Psychrosphaera saromensis TaxID=716813 RepID=A0A2S7UUH6_9GAMM|nr:hypothetical protein [Psychrosphaera saromensis]PQJ53593.1 hypothetical protein BTO11_07880 [Psychrosphaera saromensis]GHB63995.1 hypothetical protein GCM10008107_11420 [Psychrosphaera saromensis]GLQ15645.1 hypothetical protein GCM10007917_31000 [Psychrosphaera saromensis]